MARVGEAGGDGGVGKGRKSFSVMVIVCLEQRRCGKVHNYFMLEMVWNLSQTQNTL